MHSNTWIGPLTGKLNIGVEYRFCRPQDRYTPNRPWAGSVYTGPVAIATKLVFTAEALLSREWPDPHVVSPPRYAGRLLGKLWYLSFPKVLAPCSGRVGRGCMGLRRRAMPDVRVSRFYRPLDMHDSVPMWVVLTGAVPPGRRSPTPSSSRSGTRAHSGTRANSGKCCTAAAPTAGMALAVVLPPAAPAASGSMKAFGRVLQTYRCLWIVGSGSSRRSRQPIDRKWIPGLPPHP